MQHYIVPPRFTLPMREDVMPVIVPKSAQHIIPYERQAVAEYLESETSLFIASPALPRRKKRSLLRSTVLAGKELIYFAMAGEAIWLAFAYFDNTVWKIVALVVTLILWSNVASSAARNKTPKEQAIEMMDTMSTQAIRLANWSRKQQEKIDLHTMSGDTTGFLIALKKSWIEAEDEWLR